MKKETLKMIDDYKNYVLIKTSDLNCNYSIRTSQFRGFVLYDGNDMSYIIEEWIKKGIEIFENEDDYNNKYPLLTPLERRARSMVFIWFSVPKEKWTEKEREYFETDNYWKEFFIKNDIANNKDKYIC